jgi:hypothetical protein
MEDSTRQYVWFLLNKIKQLYKERSVLEGLLRSLPVESLRTTWEQNYRELLDAPKTQKEIDAKFDEPIAQALRSIDNQEIVC